ncbi:hypothetical protein BG015_003795 [Linnemannia schmuckeri]|uniref:Uncharacterized protein n=1 Tax=Linnemannia schmuckeri TaxID=64567 RepID=A0A9P5S4G0_9FUNG|nr:hypothetical protein BG015_003795 [Linnemannia schmuckeri]
MDRTKPKPKEHHGSNPSATSQAQLSQPLPKLIHGTSIDYQERAKRLRLTGPPPDHDLNPFNAPTVNKIENMFERVMMIAKSSSSSSSTSQPARRHNLFAPPQSSFSSTRTYERHQTKPEEKDTIASTFTHARHEQSKSNLFSLSSNSRSYIPVATAISQGNHRYSRQPIPSVWSTISTRPTTSEADEKTNRYRYMLPPMDAATTTSTRPMAINTHTQEEPKQQQRQEPVYQQLSRAPMNTQAAVAPPSLLMKRPLSPDPPASEVADAASDDDVVEILSSDDEQEDERELSVEDEEHYSYSDEEELEEEEEFEQYSDGQQVILDDDDDDVDVGHSKEPRWVDELDEAYLTRHERHHHNYSQELREIEAAQEDSQEEDAVDVEDDDEVEEEYDDDEDVTGEHQADEEEEEESPEELRRRRNEMNRQLRGQMGMSMGKDMSNAPRYGQRHSLGLMEPLNQEDGEFDEGVSDEEDPEGDDEHDDREAGKEAAQDVIREEEYPSDEEPFEGDEEVYRDGDELREIHDDVASSEGESEIDSLLAQPHLQPASLSRHLQENLRHLESAIPPQERYDSPTDNVVMLLDSDEEEEEYPQEDNEAEGDDDEREVLEYEGDSQNDQEGEYEQDQEAEYNQSNYATQDDKAWKDGQDVDSEGIDDIWRSRVAEVNSVSQIVGEGIAQDDYAHGVAESRASHESQDPYEQPRTFTSSTSSSGFGESASLQSHVGANVQLNLGTDQDDIDGDAVEEAVKVGTHQFPLDVVQDEEMQSQPASPAGEYEVEQRFRYMDSGGDVDGHDTVVVAEPPRLTDARNDLPLADVVMTEVSHYQELPSALEFESGTDTVIRRMQPEEDLPSAGIVVDETEESEELLQMSAVDSGAENGTSQAQMEQVSIIIATSTVSAESGVALIDEPHTEAHLDQQEVQLVIGIEGEHGPEAFVTPLSQPASGRTPLLDRLHSIAQEENINLQSPVQSTLSTSTELFSTPTFIPSDFMQPAQSTDSPESPTSFTTPTTSSAAADAERSELTPTQPRRTRLTRMSTIAQTVRDGQAYMNQLAARSSPNSSKSNSASTADSHSTDSLSSSPSLKRGSTGSSHGRTAANMVLLVKEAREFCAGGPSRVGSTPMDEEPVRDTALTEEAGGQAVLAEDRGSSVGSQPSTPHKSGVVDLVAELVIQSKVKGHHALRVNPSPGRSPVINSTPSRSSSQEPSIILPMVPQHALSQPPPPVGPSSSVFTFGQGSPSKGIPVSPSVGFGFGTSFVTTSKERRISVGSASSKTSPRKGTGLVFEYSGLDSENASSTVSEPTLLGTTEVAEVEGTGGHQDQEMKSAIGTLDAVEIESPGQLIEIEEDDDGDMAGEEASSNRDVGAEDESDSEDEDEDVTTSETGATTGAAAEDKEKKARKAGRGKKPAPKVQAKRLKRRELFWQKKQLEMQQLQRPPLPPQE